MNCVLLLEIKMSYTVKQLAELSGVSIRTLHWYDQIGLLKPAYYGDNNYRYYEEEQLLLLQQILFFKELGFSLDDIQKLLDQNDFDKIEALYAHKDTLEESINRMKKLIDTVNKTILRLRGKNTMTDKELYYGFDVKLPKSGKYVVKCQGIPSEKVLEHFKKDDVVWSKEQWAEFKDEVDSLDMAIARLIEDGLSPKDDKVQKLVHRHFELQENFFNLTKEAYMALIEMYEADNPELRKFWHAYHPKMWEFLCEAMRVYAKKLK